MFEKAYTISLLILAIAMFALGLVFLFAKIADNPKPVGLPQSNEGDVGYVSVFCCVEPGRKHGASFCRTVGQ
jgi:hypothetical protein